MNKIILYGTIAERIKCYQSSDIDHVDFILAVKRKNGTEFIDCISYGRVAKSVLKKCRPEDLILVIGHLYINSEKKAVVIVDSFDCIGFRVSLKRKDWISEEE